MTENSEVNDYKCVVGVVFIGGCGSNNLRLTMTECTPTDYPDFLLFGADTDAKVQQLFYGSEIDPHRELWDKAGALTICPWGKKVTQGRGAGANPKIGKAAAKASEGALKSFYKKVNKVILVGAVGGGTGTAGLPFAAKLAKKMGKTTLAIVVIPETGEGKNSRSTEAFGEIVSLVPTIGIRNAYLKEHMKNMPEEVRKKMNHKGAWRVVNQHSIVPMILLIREIIQITGDQRNLDESDWDTLMTKYGNHVLFGLAEFDPTMAESIKAEEVVKQLFAAPFQDGAIAQHGNSFALWNHGISWPFELCNEIRDQAKTEILGDKKGVEIEVHQGVANEVTDGKMWVAMLIVAKELGPKPVTDSVSKGVEEKKSLPCGKPVEKKLLTSPQTVNGIVPKTEETSTSPTFGISYTCDEVRVYPKVFEELGLRYNKAITDPNVTREMLIPILDEVEKETEKWGGKALRPDLPKRLQPPKKEEEKPQAEPSLLSKMGSKLGNLIFNGPGS